MGRIDRGDVCAGLGVLKSRESLALLVVAGLADSADKARLMIEVRRALCCFDWFDSGDMRSSRFRVQLHSVFGFAVRDLICDVGFVGLSVSHKSVVIGVSRKCYSATWLIRERNIFQLINQWSIDGDRALYNQLSSRVDVF
jgi:hypothetical protein